MFVHLHNHTHYSILEWLPKPKDYVKIAKKLWMSAVAITDTSNIYGCHELYKTAKDAWIKPILWTEIYVESVLDSKINHKLVLLAKSLNGYRNIIELTTKANLGINWIWKVPKIQFSDIEELKEKKGDLEIVCLSGPFSGEIPYFILAGKNDDEIISRINDYKNIFWEENYYIELLYHDDIPKQNFITDKLIELVNKYELNSVATNNCFYISKEDKKTQDVIVALWTGHELENPDRPTMMNWDYSFLTEEEMQALFWFIPKALENTAKIADMVNIEIETGWTLIPVYELPEEDKKNYDEAIQFDKQNHNNNTQKIKTLTSDEWYLRYLSFIGLNTRYNTNFSKEIIFKLIQKLDKPWLTKKLTDTSLEELKTLSKTYYSEEKEKILLSLPKELQDKIEKLEYELVVVHEMWFDAYFLIVADYINRAKNNDISVWPWRGSAAWSLMAFLTWITDIDPLNYNLLFERFLNPARISMPDIDTDFADTGRDKVVDYCRKKYGNDRVAQICTFWTFAARAAVKDVWRTYWVPFAEMNDLAKLIPEKPWTKLKDALLESLEFKEAYENNPKYKEIIDNALKIEWNVRQLWVHACAVIISPQPMTNFTALQYPPKDNNSIITQYEAHALEDLGLLKMDFLWLRNLTIIKRAQKIIKNTKKIDINISKIDLNDKKVFKVFAKWDTTWIFQFESDWMRKYLKDLWPDSFEDLIAMVSLYRPWPLAYIPTYIDVKSWKKEKKYLTPELVEILKNAWYSEKEIKEEWRKLEEDLWPILDITYWIAVYQEQLMFIVQYMAWFSLWEADLLRRWVWKKKIEVIEALKKEFIEKWEKYKQYKPETTNYIYMEMIMPAANYSFNKSHAACYALIAYQTAFLKAYYKTEFMSALMSSDENNIDRIVSEVSECENLWISVLPPSINESMKHFTYIDDKKIRFGLKAIKWIWDWPIEKIMQVRKNIPWWFKNIQEFIETCWKEVSNKKTLEWLILSGAMDMFWVRKQLFLWMDEITKFNRRDEKRKETSQIWLFDNYAEFKDKLELKECEEFSFEEKLFYEQEIIGFSISGHPLDWLKKYCTRRWYNTKKLKEDFEDIEKSWNNEWDEKTKDEKVQTVWVIIDIRKIITKTWKPMIFLKCEWFDYDFEVIVFPKDIEKYKDKFELNKIIIVTWLLNINYEYKRKSIKSKDIKFLSITEARAQAEDLQLFDNSKRLMDLNKKKHIENKEALEDENSLLENDLESKKGESNFEEELEGKVQENKQELEEKIVESFIIQISKTARKEDLQELKNFILTLKTGNIKIFLDLKWQKIDTKISLNNLDKLKEWLKINWNYSQ